MHAKILMLLLIALAGAGVLAGCGQSEEEKAADQVCSARDDIAKQVDQLQGLTLTTATTDQVRENADGDQGRPVHDRRRADQPVRPAAHAGRAGQQRLPQRSGEYRRDRRQVDLDPGRIGAAQGSLQRPCGELPKHLRADRLFVVPKEPHEQRSRTAGVNSGCRMAREYEGAHRIGANSRPGTRRNTRAR